MPAVPLPPPVRRHEACAAREGTLVRNPSASRGTPLLATCSRARIRETSAPMTLWIVHREPAARAALARLLQAGGQPLEGALRTGPPDLAAFAAAEDGTRGAGGLGPPPAVILGLEDDLERELGFVRALLERHPDAGLVLVHPPACEAEVEARFDGAASERLSFPPDAGVLRRAAQRLLAQRRGPALAAPRRRARLEERFARWFADLPLPRAEASAWQRARTLVRGEPGSGRMLLARTLHERASRRAGAFVHVACDGRMGLAELAAALERDRAAWGEPGAVGRGLTLCLEGVEALAPAVQRGLRSWIELGPPAGDARAAAPLRWIAVADLRGPELDGGLVDVLADLSIRIPPLRERTSAIVPFVRATAAHWGAALGERARDFSADALERLREDPWPGNLRELEAVVVRCLARDASEPVDRSEVESWLSALRPRAEAPDGPHEPEPARQSVPRREPGGTAAAAATPEPGPVAPAEAASETEPEPQPPRALRSPGADAERSEREPAAPALPRLALSLAHALRNPLTGIRAFAALLPERFDDEEFREDFRSRVEEDVVRMEGTLDCLQAFAGLGERHPARVDVAALLEGLLEARRPEIQRRRLVVLQELDRSHPFARVDGERLRFAFAALLDRALAWIPDRADLYVASRHHPAGPGDEPSLRVLLRFPTPGGAGGARKVPPPRSSADLAPQEHAVELALAEATLRGEGARVSLETAGGDTVLLLDLPAPEDPDRREGTDPDPTAHPAVCQGCR